MAHTKVLTLLQENLLYLMNGEVLLDDPPCIVVKIELKSGSLVGSLCNWCFLLLLRSLSHIHIVSTLHNGNRCHYAANYGHIFTEFRRGE